jgi:hypothetical protein
MFARLYQSIGRLLSASDERTPNRHDTFFASSSDLADLERRMRQVDEDDHAYRLSYCCARPRERHVSISNF